jgi:NADPH:quinone reductase-like Zn-dependent oxidoreductase
VIKPLVHRRRGSPDARDIRDPQPGPTLEVLIGVHAAARNAADRFLLLGEPSAILAMAGGRRSRANHVPEAVHNGCNYLR